MTVNRRIYRHCLCVRITHWINAICMTVLLMSGLQIFNAHPALYWGNASRFDAPLADIGAFPSWATLPGSEWLAMGRRWHFFFAWLFVANGTVYTLVAILGGHFHAISCRRYRIYGGSAIRSGSICGCVFPKGRRRGATMCCRSSPI
jgi:thiosulfate reductase cytochrome b subunit